MLFYYVLKKVVIAPPAPQFWSDLPSPIAEWMSIIELEKWWSRPLTTPKGNWCFGITFTMRSIYLYNSFLLCQYDKNEVKANTRDPSLISQNVIVLLVFSLQNYKLTVKQVSRKQCNSWKPKITYKNSSDSCIWWKERDFLFKH